MIPRGVTTEIPLRTFDAYICINDPTLITIRDFFECINCVYKLKTVPNLFVNVSSFEYAALSY